MMSEKSGFSKLFLSFVCRQILDLTINQNFLFYLMGSRQGAKKIFPRLKVLGMRKKLPVLTSIYLLAYIIL